MRLSLAYPLQSNRRAPLLPTSAGVLLAAVVLGGIGGCLFTDPINMAPGNFKIIAPDPIYHGTTPSFTTTSVSDPDGDSVAVEWAVMKVCPPGMPFVPDCTACDLGSTLNQSNWPRPEQRTRVDRYDVNAALTDQAFCVWAFAVDSKGAIRPAIHLATPVNRAPVAKISVLPHPPLTLLTIPSAFTPPYPLYSVLELSSAESTDADRGDMGTLLSEWKVTNSRGLDVVLENCPGASATDGSRCFTADMPGSYHVTLTVSDQYQGVDIQTVAVDVAGDQLPCIVDTELMPKISKQPLPGTFDQNLDLAVNTVQDDGDSVPRMPPSPYAEFRWYAGKSGTRLRYVGGNYKIYTVPATDYSLGNLVKVRVEFLDRNRAEIESILAGCGDADTCGMTPTCHQRVTWTIQY